MSRELTLQELLTFADAHAGETFDVLDSYT